MRYDFKKTNIVISYFEIEKRLRLIGRLERF